MSPDGYDEVLADLDSVERPVAPMSPLVSLGALAHQAALSAGSAGVAGPADDASPAELIACLPTPTSQRLAADAVRAARACPAGEARHTRLTARADLLVSEYRLAKLRDHELELRRAISPAYSDCICLGLGGAGEVIVGAVAAPGGLLAVVDPDGAQVTTFSVGCPCPDGQRHTERIRDHAAAAGQRYRARRIELIAGRAEIPSAYHGLTTATWAEAAVAHGARAEATLSIAGAITHWRALVGTRDRLHPRCLLYLAGNPGVGKSGLASAEARVWVEAERSVLYRSVPRIAGDLRAAPFRRDREADSSQPRVSTEADLLAAYQEADLLVLDDLGTESLVGADGERVRERLFEIVDRRLAECRPTIVTTNLGVGQVGERYGRRFADRVGSVGTAVRVHLGTPNLRLGANGEA